jgi:hypothetical protein
MNLSLARAEVVLWLDATAKNHAPPGKDGAQVSPVVPEEELPGLFLDRVRRHGFDLELLPVHRAGQRLLRGFWTLHGNTFVGFQQAAEAPEEDDARLLACAALLRNDWCRGRLSK